MSTTVRVQLALAALGAGLVHLAVAAGADLPLAIGFGICGIAELVWAGSAIARTSPPLVKAIPALALAPIALWGVGLALPAETSSTMPFLALGIATVLDLVVAIGIGITLRRPAAEARAGSGARFTAALIVGAFAMSALVMPALGATSAGIAASSGPHSMHQTGAELTIPTEHDGH